jgi:hypothetical protein
MQRLGFVLGLNKAAAPYGETSQAGFSSDLLSLFDPSPKAAESEDPDAWADVSIDTPAASVMTKLDERGAEALPDISSIVRPEVLTKRPPYWLIVRQESRNRVVVEGSHDPSIILLEGYLKKWCRGNINRTDRVSYFSGAGLLSTHFVQSPLVDMKLHESVFGLGLMHDSLVLEAVRGREVNVTLILVFVETVLGYPLLDGSASRGVWEFKRTRGFK